MEWPAVLTAISTTVIAIAAVGVGLMAMPLLRQSTRTAAALQSLSDRLERDSGPLLDTARSVANDAREVSAKLRREMENVVDVSTDVRQRVLTATDAAEERLLDLQALLDVFQDEIEDTVLDVSAALRTTRRGTAILGSMKRALMGGGKRRKRRRKR